MDGLPISKISEKGGKINPGDTIGIAFNHGKLDHPVYGTMENCSGIIPLMLPAGEFQFPPVLNDHEAIEKRTKELRAEFWSLWEEELDEDIEKKIKENIILGALVLHSSGYDIWTDEAKELIIQNATTFIVDDVVDAMDDMTENGLDIKILENAIDKIQSSGEFDLENFPNLTPKLVPYFQFIKSQGRTNKLFRRTGRLGPGTSACKNMIAALFLVKEAGRNPEEGLSEDSLMDLMGHQSGVLGFFERAILDFNKPDVSPQIREDILFRRLGICLANASTLFNAVIGLPRDIEKDQVKDSPILTSVVKHGLSLQEGFNKTFRQMTNALHDIRIISKKLKERFHHDPAVLHYANYAMEFVDIQLYAYMFFFRYGELNLKVEKI